MKKIIYIFLTLTLFTLSLLRIDIKTNIDSYGFVHREVVNNSGFKTSMFPFDNLEGYLGSMLVLILLCINVLILFFVNYKYDFNNRVKNRLFLMFFGISLLVFEETLIRVLGIIILSILVYKYVFLKSENSISQ